MSEFKVVKDETTRHVIIKNDGPCILPIGDDANSSLKATMLEIRINGSYKIDGKPLTQLKFFCSKDYWKQLRVGERFKYGQLIDDYEFSSSKDTYVWKITGISANLPHSYVVECSSSFDLDLS